MEPSGKQCAVVELRQYTLHPGRRDELIDLFERELLEPQEAAGMTLIGQFRVLGDGDRFVWLRGFTDMNARAKALAAFYGGPVWAANRKAANATMIDSDNVLLLRPLHQGCGFASSGEPFPRTAAEASGRLFAANVQRLGATPDGAALSHLERVMCAAVSAAGGSILGSYVSEQSPNDYPALPVREDVNVFVLFAAFPNAAKLDGCLRSPAFGRQDGAETIRLCPTSRSRLR